jgi:hypothetical protein
MKLRNRFTVVVLLASLAAVALAGPASAAPAKTVPPNAWATSICTVMSGWIKGYQSGEQQLTTTLAGTSVAPADAKAALDGFFATGTTATRQAIAALKKAGAPKAKSGTGIANSLVGAFTAIQKQVAAAKKKVAALDSTHAEYDTQAKAVIDGLDTNIGKALAKFSAYGKKHSDKALTKIMNTNSTCANLGS